MAKGKCSVHPALSGNHCTRSPHHCTECLSKRERWRRPAWGWVCRPVLLAAERRLMVHPLACGDQGTLSAWPRCVKAVPYPLKYPASPLTSRISTPFHHCRQVSSLLQELSHILSRRKHTLAMGPAARSFPLHLPHQQPHQLSSWIYNCALRCSKH